MENWNDWLYDRLDKNLAEFKASVQCCDKESIMDMAQRIHMVMDTHYYLTNVHEFEPGETAYLLRFENPLEVVADAWERRCEDISDMSFALDEVFEKKDALKDYPLAPEENPAEMIHGYEIRESTVFSTNRGFALAVNPKAVQPFVTWQFTEDSGNREYYWGHYFTKEPSAIADYAARVEEYKADFVKDVPASMPEQKQSILEQLKEAKQVSRISEDRDKPVHSGPAKNEAR